MRIPAEAARRLWLHLQGLSHPRSTRLTKKRFIHHLERTGGLQLDSVNVVDRAHYLTLWSRFGNYDRDQLDRWIYRDRVAYEYWGHEASILPLSHLPISRRAMRGANWKEGSLPTRRVLQRLRREGPLESADFQTSKSEGPWWGWKKDKRALEYLWWHGKVAIHGRRHFRRIYDLAERIYPKGPIVTTTELEDSWLLVGLRGNGIATEKHLTGYFTSPRLAVADRRKVIARNLKRKKVVEVEVAGVGRALALTEHLRLLNLPKPRGTTLLSPFDSLLWKRERAEDLMNFHYRVEIYVPPAKRKFGYYAMPILHDGALVGRVDPKLHRDRNELEIRAVRFEPGFKPDQRFRRKLEEAIGSLTEFATGLRSRGRRARS